MLLFEEQKVTKNSLRTETRTQSSVDFILLQLKQSVRIRLTAIGFKPNTDKSVWWNDCSRNHELHISIYP